MKQNKNKRDLTSLEGSGKCSMKKPRLSFLNLSRLLKPACVLILASGWQSNLKITVKGKEDMAGISQGGEETYGDVSEWREVF